MKFSIIVAIYNIQAYIDDCVNSIISQSYGNFELLLVNDGSTDGSLALLKEWASKDARIKVIDKPNGGLSSARNEGLKYASGDYVLFVDGDDWLAKDALLSAKDFVENHGDVDMLCFDYWAYYSDSDKKLISYEAATGVHKGVDFFRNSVFKLTAWSKFYKRQFLSKIGLFFLEGRLHEDLSYTIPLCFCSERIGYINSPLYFYRQNRQGSIMNKVSRRNVLDFSHALCFDYYFLKERKLLNEYVSRWLINGFYKACFTSETNFQTLYSCFKENKVDIVCKEMGEGVMFFFKLWCYHSIARGKKKLKSIYLKIV